MRKKTTAALCLCLLAGILLFINSFQAESARDEALSSPGLASPTQIASVDSQTESATVPSKEPSASETAPVLPAPPARWPNAQVLAFRESPGADGSIKREWLLDTGRPDLPVRVLEKGRSNPKGEFEWVAYKEAAAHRILLVPTGGADAAVIQAIFPDAAVEMLSDGQTLRVSRSEYDLDTLPELMKLAQENPDIVFFEPDYIYRPSRVPNDPGFEDLWHLNNTRQFGGVAGADIDAEAAWDVRTSAGNTVIAVIDTGLRTTHQDIAPNLWFNPGEVSDGIDNDNNGYVDDINGINAPLQNGALIDDDGHGTHVSGIAAAQGNNGVGVTGVAWDASIMGVKFLVNGTGSTSDAIRAIDYAISEQADIINASWGGPGDSFTLLQAIARTQSAGILFVAAAGNEASNNDFTSSYPANYELDNIISVGSSTPADTRSSFSNYGANTVDIFAPGSDIISTWYTADNEYATLSGTSMAAPVVTGALALMSAQFPGDSYLQLYARLMTSVDRPAGLAGVSISSGRLNINGALNQSSSVQPPIIVVGLGNVETDIGSNVTFSVSATGSEPLTYEWRKNGDVIVAETDSSLLIESIEETDAGTYSVEVSNSAGSISSSAELSIVEDGLSLADTVDDPDGNWLTTGDSNWRTTTEDSVIGVSSLRSGPIGDEQASTIRTTVEGAGTACFYWRVSSEQSYDYLFFSVDGVTRGAISGETNWREICIELGEGSHVLEWTYSKDVFVAEGDDAGYIDGFTFTDAPSNAPTIVSQPLSAVLAVGDSYVISVDVTGAEPLNYIWIKNDQILSNNSNYSGTTTSALSIREVSADVAGLYRVFVSNQFGSATSLTVQITVGQGLPPQIVRQPRSTTLGAGEEITLSVGVDGSAPFTFQWYKDDQTISGANTFSLTLSDVGLDDSGVYTVQVTNSSGSVLSDEAEVLVIEASIIPVFLKHPLDTFVNPGESFTLSTEVGGSEPMTFQWYKDDEAIEGATAIELQIVDAQTVDTGEYRIEATNEFGTTSSRVGRIIVAGGEEARRLALNVSSQLELADSSDASWVVQQDQTDNDQLALQSGEISNNQTSTLSTYVVGPGLVYFRWKVSSEVGDRLQFRVDGSTQFSISGEVDWETRSWTIGEGIHRLDWVYVKDAADSTGLDAGFLDRFYLADGVEPFGAAHYFVGSIEVGGDWIYAPGFGALWGGGFRWIYHLEQGWLYMSGIGGTTYWAYDPAMGWIFTGSELYPFIFSSDEAAWLFYLSGTNNPRLFLNNITGQLYEFP